MKKESYESFEAVRIQTLGVINEKEKNVNSLSDLQNLKMKDCKSRGITLIALVVTIVVLLILAAITITFVLGDNGIIKTAEIAGNKTGRADFIEKARLDATAKQVENLGKLTQDELVEILEKHGTISNTGKESILDEDITSKDEKYVAKVREIWDGKLEVETTVKFSFEGGRKNYDKTKIYEVPVGTTWMQFFTDNRAELGGSYGFLHYGSSGPVLHYIDDFGARVETGYLYKEKDWPVKEEGLEVCVEEKIKSRKLYCFSNFFN